MEQNGIILSKLLNSHNVYFSGKFNSLAEAEYNNNYIDENKSDEILSKEQIWFETYDESLNAIPKEMYDTLTDPQNEQEMYNIFKECVKSTNFEMPKFIKKYFIRNKELMIRTLGNILSSDIVNEDIYLDIDKYTYEDFDIYIESTKVSRLFKELAPILFDALSRCNNGNEVIFDNLSHSLGYMGVFNEIISYINEEKVVLDKHLSLIDILAVSGVKNDEIYYCMKNAFKKAEDHEVKNILAFCFLNYGDPRIVPLLRKFAKEQTDKENLHMLCSMIDDLGGNTEDIRKF